VSNKLVIDINKCEACEKCTVQCGYLYQPQITEHGILALREQVYFQLVCRRCEEPSCVASCPFEALERKEDGVLVRHNMRCMSCKNCCHACPFGTIYPETVPYLATSCDFCLMRKDGAPPCVVSCVKNAIEYHEVSDEENDGLTVLNDNLAVLAPQWDKTAV